MVMALSRPFPSLPWLSAHFYQISWSIENLFKILIISEFSIDPKCGVCKSADKMITELLLQSWVRWRKSKVQNRTESCRGLSSGLKLVTNCPKVRGDVHFKSGSSALWETNSLVHLKEVDDLDIKIKVLFILWN